MNSPLPPQKHHTLLLSLLSKPTKPPFLGNPLIYWFSMNPQNVKVFHPSPHLLKVTKFFVKISQLEFVVMTE